MAPLHRCLISFARTRRRSLHALSLLAAAMMVSGCAPTSGGLSVLFVVTVLLLGISSCISGGETSDGDVTTNDDGTGGFNYGGGGTSGGAFPRAGGGSGGTGRYETCCINGITSSCFCPGDQICNFGWFTEFYPDGTCCAESAEQVCRPGSGDAGGTGLGGGGQGGGGPGGGGQGGDGPGGGGFGGLAGGGSGGEGGGFYWEECCVNDVVTLCECPINHSCNFGWDLDQCGAGGAGGIGNAGGGAGGATP